VGANCCIEVPCTRKKVHYSSNPQHITMAYACSTRTSSCLSCLSKTPFNARRYPSTNPLSRSKQVYLSLQPTLNQKVEALLYMARSKLLAQTVVYKPTVPHDPRIRQSFVGCCGSSSFITCIPLHVLGHYSHLSVDERCAIYRAPTRELCAIRHDVSCWDCFSYSMKLSHSSCQRS